MRIAVMEPDTVSHYMEARVNFLLMDARLGSGVALSCLGGETGR